MSVQCTVLWAEKRKRVRHTLTHKHKEQVVDIVSSDDDDEEGEIRYKSKRRRLNRHAAAFPRMVSLSLWKGMIIRCFDIPCKGLFSAVCFPSQPRTITAISLVFLLFLRTFATPSPSRTKTHTTGTRHLVPRRFPFLQHPILVKPPTLQPKPPSHHLWSLLYPILRTIHPHFTPNRHSTRILTFHHI